MTTVQIEQYANIADISHPDIDLKVLLRHNVIPAFLSDVGYVAWRRKVTTLSLVQGTQEYDLASDFLLMQVVTLDPSPSNALKYIGDDPESVMAAEANTTQAKPTGWYLVRRTTTNLYKKIRFNSPPDTTYTGRYTYYMEIPFTDDTTSVEMNLHIPAQYQWALVEGLKKEIMFIRFGIGDPRYVASEQAYGMWIERVRENPEHARRTSAAFVR